MPDEDVQLPLSGAVTIAQSFFPVTINVGRSGSAAAEKDALTKASYGRQLGRIGDALIVLLNHVPLGDLEPDEQTAIKDLKEMLRQMAKVKEAHGAKHILWP